MRGIAPFAFFCPGATNQNAFRSGATRDGELVSPA
jgi:hypothetical protein